MEIEWENPVMWGMTILMYLVVIVMIWKMSISSGEFVRDRIIMTVLAAPLIFFIVNWQMSR